MGKIRKLVRLRIVSAKPKINFTECSGAERAFFCAALLFAAQALTGFVMTRNLNFREQPEIHVHWLERCLAAIAFGEVPAG